MTLVRRARAIPASKLSLEQDNKESVHLVGVIAPCVCLQCAQLPAEQCSGDKSESDVVPKPKEADQTKRATKPAGLDGAPSYKVPGFACPLRRSHGTEVGWRI